MARTTAAPISDYERKRQEQIAKNQALLRDLALDAASAGLAPQSKARSSAPAKSQKKKTAPKKVEEVVPRRTSSRLRGIVADSEVAKRKAEEEHEALREAERLKRQRVSGALSLTDIGVGGKEWNLSGNFLRITGPAEPGLRTFKVEDVKETGGKELKALRERMSGLRLWEEFTPNEIKMVPERVYAMAFHPSTEKPLIFAGDKMGNLGICDCRQSAPEVKTEEDEEEEDRTPAISTLKIHTRTISAFQFHPTDPNNLYSASYDSSIRKTDLAKGVAVEVYAPADASIDDPLSGIDFSPLDPHTIFFTTLDGKLGRHDLRSPQGSSSSGGTETFQLSEKKIGGFSLHPQQPHLLATASLDRTLKLWDLRRISGRGAERRPALLGEHESKLSVSHAAFNAAGQVATSSYDDTVKIYDFSDAAKWKVGEELAEEKMKPATVVPHNNQTGRWVTILKPQWQQRPQDGLQRFVIGNMNRFVDVYAANGQQLAQLGDPELVTAVPAVAQFHPTMDWIAGGTASGKLCLWM